MNTIVTVVAWINLILAALVLLSEPIRAAVQGKRFGSDVYIGRLISGIMLIILIGRCLAWW